MLRPGGVPARLRRDELVKRLDVGAVEGVVSEASRALALDAHNSDALVARCVVVLPFGRFIEAEVFLDRLRSAPGTVEGARLGPAGKDGDIMGPDGYRTALLFQANMPELRNDPRFPRLCARLGLVAFWQASGQWPDCADEVPYDFRRECARVQGVPEEGFGF